MQVQRVASGDGRVIVAAEGQIDLASAPQLVEALAEETDAGPQEIVVDLADVDFLDSVGVRVLVEAAQEAFRAGVELSVAGARGWVARVLEITGVAEHLRLAQGAAPDG